MIVALAGRRIDAPGAHPKRFPLALAKSVKSKLIAVLESVDAKQLVCSGACGTDLLALQAADELGISQIMILPFDAKTFRSTSVTDRPGEWGSIFDKLITKLKETNRLIELNYGENDDDAYLGTNFSILDQAQQIAGIETTETTSNVIAVIVWEGKPKDAGDTTYHFKKEAEKRNIIVKEILINES